MHRTGATYAFGVTTSRATTEAKTSAAAGCGFREIRGLVTELGRRLDAHQRSRIAELDLTPTQAKALEELGEPKTARELAAVLCCEPPNVTYVISKLEKQGMVVRRPDPADGRAKQLVLTEAGRELRLTCCGGWAPRRRWTTSRTTSAARSATNCSGRWAGSPASPLLTGPRGALRGPLVCLQ